MHITFDAALPEVNLGEKKKDLDEIQVLYINGTPGWIRTSGFQLRRLTLYPLSYGRMVDNGGKRELMDCGSKVKHRNRNGPEQALRNGYPAEIWSTLS